MCIRDRTLYHLYEIPAAASKEELGSPAVAAKVEKAAALGMVHGAYEGEELQLPAMFLLDEDCTVLYARYAANGADLPTIDEMVAML